MECKRGAMSKTDTMISHFIFKCGYSKCKEGIPVELKIEKQEGNWAYELATLRLTCPFCGQRNHFSIKDRIKEINKREYDVMVKAIGKKLKQRKKPPK
jgi:hypothetical protein